MTGYGMRAAGRQAGAQPPARPRSAEVGLRNPRSTNGPTDVPNLPNLFSKEEETVSATAVRSPGTVSPGSLEKQGGKPGQVGHTPAIPWPFGSWKSPTSPTWLGTLFEVGRAAYLFRSVGAGPLASGQARIRRPLCGPRPAIRTANPRALVWPASTNGIRRRMAELWRNAPRPGSRAARPVYAP